MNSGVIMEGLEQWCSTSFLAREGGCRELNSSESAGPSPQERAYVCGNTHTFLYSFRDLGRALAKL